MLKLKNYVRGRYIYYERIGGHGGSASWERARSERLSAVVVRQSSGVLKM